MDMPLVNPSLVGSFLTEIIETIAGYMESREDLISLRLICKMLFPQSFSVVGQIPLEFFSLNTTDNLFFCHQVASHFFETYTTSLLDADDRLDRLLKRPELCKHVKTLRIEDESEKNDRTHHPTHVRTSELV